MSESIQVSDLATDEIRELLAEQGASLSDDQVRALAQFIDEVGGLQQALAVFDASRTQQRAA